MQITDYIWTLQEFNLISENNNKYSIKNKKILDNFAVECGLKPIDIKVENSLKLSKTCKTCGKTLGISKFFIYPAGPRPGVMWIWTACRPRPGLPRHPEERCAGPTDCAA